MLFIENRLSVDSLWTVNCIFESIKVIVIGLFFIFHDQKTKQKPNLFKVKKCFCAAPLRYDFQALES